MKFTWFNLMPWPYLPDDFREKNRSVWVDIDQTLFDPVKSHEVYNTYMDLLEYAGDARLRRHRRQRASPERLRHHAVARTSSPPAWRAAPRTSALVVLGNSIALYNPPIRVAEEFAMLDCISGGRLVAGFPVGTSMDTNYCYGQIPALTREKYAGSARPDHQGLDRRASRSPSTAATTSCATSTSGRGRSSSRTRRSTFPAAARSRPTTSASTTPIPTPTCQLHRLHPRQGADGRLLGARRRAQRAGHLALSRRLRADHLRRRHRRGGRAALLASTSTISTIAACTSIRASPTRRATAPSRPSRPARCRNTRRRAAATPS